MAYFFSAPDFYSMQKDRRERTEKQIDDFVQSGPLAQWARYKQAKKAMARQEEQEARQKQIWDMLYKQGGGNGIA